MKRVTFTTAIIAALTVFCIYQAAAQSPGLSIALQATPDPIWPGGPFSVNAMYTLDTPGPVDQADATFVLNDVYRVTELPAECAVSEVEGQREVMSCSFSGLQQGTHPLFTGNGIAGTVDPVTPSPLLVEASLDAHYPDGPVSASDSKNIGVSTSVPGDSINLVLTSMISPVIAGGTILYDVWYDLNSNLLIDHSYVTYNLDPAVTITSVGINCQIEGKNTAQCGSMEGGIQGGTSGWLSGIGFGGITGNVDSLVTPAHPLVSTVTFSGVYDGGWGTLNAENTTATPVVPVPEFSGPSVLFLTLAGLSAVTLWVKRRGQPHL